MQVLTKVIHQLGTVRFERRKRMRNINIHVEPFSGVRVSFPYWVSLKKAEHFLDANTVWVKSRLDHFAKSCNPQTNLFSNIDIAAAKEKLVKRLAELAQQYNFSYTRVTIRNQKTRWGSCSSKDAISLNIKLAQVPQELSDYVLLHELMHTRIKSHGPIFWHAMQALLPNARLLHRQLAAYTLPAL